MGGGGGVRCPTGCCPGPGVRRAYPCGRPVQAAHRQRQCVRQELHAAEGAPVEVAQRQHAGHLQWWPGEERRRRGRGRRALELA